MATERKKAKMEWRKPELSVIMRNEPEEAVLTYCKGNEVGLAVHNQNGGCWTFSCSGDCSTISVS